MPHAAKRTGVPFGLPPDGVSSPDKNDGAQEASGIRVAFSLVSFVCGKLPLHFPYSPHPCGLAKLKEETRLRVLEPDYLIIMAKNK
jgi:hypothetical protein